jgi:hypothetical protein
MEEQAFGYKNLSVGKPENKYKIRTLDSYGE